MRSLNWMRSLNEMKLMKSRLHRAEVLHWFLQFQMIVRPRSRRAPFITKKNVRCAMDCLISSIKQKKEGNLQSHLSAEALPRVTPVIGHKRQVTCKPCFLTSTSGGSMPVYPARVRIWVRSASESRCCV